MFQNGGFFLWAILELESGKDAIAILHAVNLFLFIGASKSRQKRIKKNPN